MSLDELSPVVTPSELVGARFGAFTIEQLFESEDGVRAICRCTCGRIAGRLLVQLATGRTRECRLCEEHARRLERAARKTPARPCAVPSCTSHVAPGRVRYCDAHGALSRHVRDRLMGRPRHTVIRAGDAGWDVVRERARDRRRERRATDPAFRAAEAKWAQRYRARKRAAAQTADPMRRAS